jgi:hypothetical protein
VQHEPKPQQQHPAAQHEPKPQQKGEKGEAKDK